MNFLISLLIMFLTGFILSGILMLLCGIFKIEFKPRKKPNDFTRLADAWDNFKLEFAKLIKIPQILDWLTKLIKK